MDSPGRSRLEQTWNSPSIMEGITDSNFQGGPPDLISAAEQDLVSLPITKSDDYHGSKTYKSFLLIDSNESLCIESEELFVKKLKCQDTDRLKVVSIFGNTGDGKSHTLNQFFNSQDVFKTSNEQSSCTIGVWSAYHPELKVLFLDTEGLLGLTNNENQRMRLLLKVLAVSDIVIYRTRAERLHRDLFSFLGTASMAFCKHFSAALNALGDPQSLGPAVVIFHETHNTKPLRPCLSNSVEDYLRKEITDVSLDLKAFCSLKYIGVQTINPPTDFHQLIHTIESELEKTEVRSPRTANVIYRALKILNSKFSGEIHDKPVLLIPEQYFTCQAVCNSCNVKCESSMDHVMECQPHASSKNCRYQHQFDNKQLLCERCFQEGRRIVVKMTSKPSNESAWIGLASRAWYGSVIECPTCGEIFRQFKHWYGNKTPEEEAVRTQIVHVWNTDELNNGNASYSAQMLVNGVSYLSGVVANVSKKPTKSLSMWMADKVAPAYWQLNSEIVICNACKKNFEQNGLKIHHCRNCGKGFCNTCSKHKMPVPSRGWAEPVRVCNECKTELLQGANGETTASHEVQSELNSSSGSVQFDEDVRVRKYGEVLLNTISSVASVLEYPKDLIKDSARPDYWVPDHQATNCALCKIEFTNSPEDVVNEKVKALALHAVDQQDFYKHHCRACGQIVCNLCSLKRRPVPERGWPSDVRVCNECVAVK